MALRKLLMRPLPEPPAEASTSQTLIDGVLAMPQLVPIRLFWDNLRELQPWWPVLLPVLLVIAVRTYRREREAVRLGE